tara:strand:+ start:308 stop:499 length:192 start_codon:yes stop_codon:yes gene_type:complete
LYAGGGELDAGLNTQSSDEDEDEDEDDDDEDDDNEDDDDDDDEMNDDKGDLVIFTDAFNFFPP